MYALGSHGEGKSSQDGGLEKGGSVLILWGKDEGKSTWVMEVCSTNVV